MGCNCKTTGSNPNFDENIKKERITHIILKYFAKILGFLVGLALLPFIMVMIIWFMFDTIVLNKEVDLRLLIDKFVKNKKFFNDDYDDEDDDEDDENEYLTEDDVIMLDVEEITKKD